MIRHGFSNFKEIMEALKEITKKMEVIERNQGEDKKGQEDIKKGQEDIKKGQEEIKRNQEVIKRNQEEIKTRFGTNYRDQRRRVPDNVRKHMSDGPLGGRGSSNYPYPVGPGFHTSYENSQAPFYTQELEWVRIFRIHMYSY